MRPSRRGRSSRTALRRRASGRCCGCGPRAPRTTRRRPPRPTPPTTERFAVTATERIRAQALALGFDAAGVAAVGPLEARQHFEAWLAAGRHGTMEWIASDESRERRGDIVRVMPEIRSVLCVLLVHPPG